MDEFDSLLDAIVAVVRTIQEKGYDALQDPIIRSALREEIELAITKDKTKKIKSIYGTTNGNCYTSGELFKRSRLQLSGASFGTSESLAKLKESEKPVIEEPIIEVP